MLTEGNPEPKDAKVLAIISELRNIFSTCIQSRLDQNPESVLVWESLNESQNERAKQLMQDLYNAAPQNFSIYVVDLLVDLNAGMGLKSVLAGWAKHIEDTGLHNRN